MAQTRYKEPHSESSLKAVANNLRKVNASEHPQPALINYTPPNRLGSGGERRLPLEIESQILKRESKKRKISPEVSLLYVH